MLYALLATSLPESALYALLGFLVVFVGIAFLILIVWLVGKCLSKISFSKDANKKKKAENTAQKDISASVTENSSAAAEEISEETVAVITAALMAYYEQTNPKCEFTVRRIKRI